MNALEIFLYLVSLVFEVIDIFGESSHLRIISSFVHFASQSIIHHFL